MGELSPQGASILPRENANELSREARCGRLPGVSVSNNGLGAGAFDFSQHFRPGHASIGIDFDPVGPLAGIVRRQSVVPAVDRKISVLMLENSMAVFLLE
jgi:hypothetical protein